MCEYSFWLTDRRDDEVPSSVAASHAESARAQASFLLGLAEFHTRQLATSSTNVWPQRRFSMPQKTADYHLQVGKDLREFPATERRSATHSLPDSSA